MSYGKYITIAVISFFALCSNLVMSSSATVGIAVAGTRAPNTEGEYSLLYWRFLCRDHAQVETRRLGSIELECESQNWKVKANDRDGQVREIQESSFK